MLRLGATFQPQAGRAAVSLRGGLGAGVSRLRSIWHDQRSQRSPPSEQNVIRPVAIRAWEFALSTRGNRVGRRAAK